MWLSIAPMRQSQEDLSALPPAFARYAEAPQFDEVHSIVMGRCSMCHADQPLWPGLLWAPKGVVLETEAQVARAARTIYLQSGVSHAMPPANLAWMDDEERALIRTWYRDATGS
jgi:uncharacterized membrane protein